MEQRFYPAIVTQDEPADLDAGYGVVFPDLPGCVSGGGTVREAAEMAAEALALHVEGMTEDGLPLPEPSPPGVIPDWLAEVPGRIVASVLVPVTVPRRGVPATVRLDTDLLREIDAAAATGGETRDGFLAAAARERLARLHA